MGDFSMKLLLTILPSVELQTKLNSYRKRYDPNYINIRPHVHFYPSFQLEDEQLPKLIADLEKFFSNKEAFPLEILRFSSLVPAENLIYCKLENHPFYSQTASYLDDLTYITKDTFISEQPHITIASDLSNDEHSDLLGRVKLIQFSKTEQIEEITLMQQLDDGKWSKVTTFSLK